MASDPVALGVLDKPLTRKEAEARADGNNFILGVVRVELCDIIEKDLAGFLDHISELLVNSVLLTEQEYHVVGHDGDTLFVEVSGDISEVYGLDDDEEEASG